MKQSLASIAVMGALLTFGSVSSARPVLKMMGLGFVAPTIAGKANVYSPAAGEIVYDSSDSKFWGRDHSGNWLDLVASSSTGTLAVSSETSGFTASSSYQVFLLSSSSFTVTLPTAVGDSGREWTFIHRGTSLTQIYTFNTTGGQTIGGVASGSYKLATSGETLRLVSDGSNWQIMEHTTQTDWVDAGANSITGTGGSNPTPGTTSVNKIYWKRNGKNADIRIEYVQTATSATVGSGDYLWALPSNMTIDTATITAFTTVIGASANSSHSNVVGAGEGRFNTANAKLGVVVYDSSNVRLYYQSPSSSGMICATAGVNVNTSNYMVIAQYSVPISGWQP